MEEGRKKQYTHDLDDVDMKNDFRKPRDILLNVIAGFYSTCQTRLRELRRILADPTYRPPDLLDFKSHNVRYQFPSRCQHILFMYNSFHQDVNIFYLCTTEVAFFIFNF
jgi:hypothetical protein